MSSPATMGLVGTENELADMLAETLANTSVVTIKAQNYHWNVTGMSFGPLHDVFQAIYEDHFEAQDTLAERAKALGLHVDGRYSQFLERATIEECKGNIAPEQMVCMLLKDQQALSRSMIKLAEVADEQGDMVTNDLAIERAAAHDKLAWMLRSHVEQNR